MKKTIGNIEAEGKLEGIVIATVVYDAMPPYIKEGMTKKSELANNVFLTDIQDGMLDDIMSFVFQCDIPGSTGLEVRMV